MRLLFIVSLLLVNVQLFAIFQNPHASSLSCSSRFSKKMSKTIRSFFAPAVATSNKRARHGVATGDVNVGKNDQPKSKSMAMQVPSSDSATAKDPSETAATSHNVTPSLGTNTKVVSTDGNLNTTGWAPLDNLEPGWRSALGPQFSRPYFQRLMAFLDKEVKAHTVYPPSSEIFTAFNLCPLDNVKV